MKFVDLHAQYLTIKNEVDAAISEVIDASAFVRGPHVDEFERRFAHAVGSANCIACGNGTDAIYVALRALGVRDGDEVITTAHSWIATSETITQAGGRVVFCDTEPGSFCIDPARIADKVTSKTVGVMPVHLYGQPADMDAILDIARRHGLWVIEDCAQAHMATYKGQTVGTFGDVGTFSFYPGKNLGAMGDAGCLVTNDDGIAEFARRFCDHGGKPVHSIEGINSRMDGLQAAVLNVKLRHLEAWTTTRQRLASQYDDLLRQAEGITVPACRDGCGHVYHQYVLKTPKRDELRTHLQRHEIPTSVCYPTPLPLLPAYRRFGHTPSEFPIAAKHAAEILSLPIYPELGADNVSTVAEIVREWARHEVL